MEDQVQERRRSTRRTTHAFYAVAFTSMSTIVEPRCPALFATWPMKARGSSLLTGAIFRTRLTCTFRKENGSRMPACSGDAAAK